MKKLSKQKAFTLTETIVTIGIFTLLALGVTSLFSHIFINSRNRLGTIDNIDQARAVTTKFTNEIRVASMGVDGSFPIGLANDDQIIFYSSYDQDSVSRIRYFASSSTLYKGITAPSGSPQSYNLTQEKISTIQNNLATSSRIFYYYDGDFDGTATSTPLSQPVNVNDIKFVRLNLRINNNNSGEINTAIDTSAGASIRNLKNNLGN